MSELDHLKEKLFDTAAVRLLGLAFAAGVSLALGILLLHRQGKPRDNFDAIARALERCDRRADGQRHLYALDELVAWRAQ